jgi:hypothetical protein
MDAYASLLDVGRISCYNADEDLDAAAHVGWGATDAVAATVRAARSGRSSGLAVPHSESIGMLRCFCMGAQALAEQPKNGGFRPLVPPPVWPTPLFTIANGY